MACPRLLWALLCLTRWASTAAAAAASADVCPDPSQGLGECSPEGASPNPGKGPVLLQAQVTQQRIHADPKLKPKPPPQEPVPRMPEPATRDDSDSEVLLKQSLLQGDPIQSGDTVYLLAHTGKMIAVEGESVHAKWGNRGEWEKLVIEKADGDGAIQAGDIVFLRAHTGKRLTAQQDGEVHARWDHQGEWQKFVVETDSGAAVESGSAVYFLVQHTGKRLTVEGEYLHAHWKHRGGWQKFTIERAAGIDNTEPPSETTVPTTKPPAETTVKTTERPAQTTVPPTGPKVQDREWEHFRLLNALRAEGFTCTDGSSYAPNPEALKFDCRLWKAAQLHSQDMADQGYFSHTSLDGRSPWKRAEAQGISANGENIAAGTNKDTAQEALDMWKKSSGHCRNMMKPSVTLMGVGHGYNANSPYRNYWTQMFKVAEVPLDTSCYP